MTEVTTTRAQDTTPLEVLDDDELAQVVGGGGTVGDVLDLAKAKVYPKIGMCGCGFAH